MRALITGAGGQLGAALGEAAGPDWSVVGLTREALDIGDELAVRTAIAAERPDLIFNAAAFTAVDRAESESQTAFRINRDGPAHLAAAATNIGARLIHISTDFVFDGRRGRPYRPADPTAPLGVYGASKLAGEEAVLASTAKALVVRTAWVYAARGRNFLLTMLRLMGERDEVRVVADQIGSPTSAASLAVALWRLAELEAGGILHLTDAGVASWYDFAVAIAEEGLNRGLLARAASVAPIATEDYPTPAARPAFSVLDCRDAWRLLGAPTPHWRASLAKVMAQLAP
ncbi:MAG: dTDP-4-dehydrorhamnose reductase [Caulobacteraceae bacterium]